MGSRSMVAAGARSHRQSHRGTDIQAVDFGSFGRSGASELIPKTTRHPRECSSWRKKLKKKEWMMLVSSTAAAAVAAAATTTTASASSTSSPSWVADRPLARSVRLSAGRLESACQPAYRQSTNPPTRQPSQGASQSLCRSAAPFPEGAFILFSSLVDSSRVETTPGRDRGITV